jgi:hypothetical protein
MKRAAGGSLQLETLGYRVRFRTPALRFKLLAARLQRNQR